MQQQQLAAQLAHHGGNSRQPPLSPTPSDSDSDISLGAHSPPISSPGPIQFGASSPSHISSFRFGPHSPGPMPAQFRFGNHTPPSYHHQSSSPPSYRRKTSTSPIDVDSTSDYHQQDSNSPITVSSPSQTALSSPPINLQMRENNLKIETPLPLRLTPTTLTTPLRIQVGAPPSSLQTTLLGSGVGSHGGIVRIAPSPPNPPPPLHRPFSPPRLT